LPNPNLGITFESILKKHLMLAFETVREIFTGENIDEQRIIRALNRCIENDRETLSIQNMAGRDSLDGEILSDMMEMQRLLNDYNHHLTL